VRLIQTSTIDYSKLKIGDTFTVFDKIVDYSLVNINSPQMISGIITDSQGNPISNANILISSNECSNFGVSSYISGQDGSFITKSYYVLKNDLATKIKIQISLAGYVQYESNVIMGGLGWVNPLSIGTIKLLSLTLTQKANIKSLIIQSLDNTPLEGVGVYLYSGQKEFSESQQTNSTSIFVDPGTNNYLRNTTSHVTGYFEFLNLDPGKYTLVFNKDGFYLESQGIYNIN
jgi:hypothetical protein